MTINQEQLKKVLKYNPDTGIFTWAASSRLVVAGEQAGWYDNGYLRIRIKDTAYRAHRLAFIYMLGREPIGHIDHKDTDRGNNRWDNLREDAERVNHWNRSMQANNTSGVKGVHWDKRKNKYIAQIQVKGRKKQVGAFSSLDDATKAIISYRKLVHGDFANNG